MTTTHNHPVDSAIRECCHGIGRHTPDCSEAGAMPDTTCHTDESRWPDLPAPDVEAISGWETGPGDTEPTRVLLGFDRTVRNHPALVYAAGTQHLDGTIHSPQVVLANGEAQWFDLSSDQARELATALIQTADEIDGWAAK